MKSLSSASDDMSTSSRPKELLLKIVPALHFCECLLWWWRQVFSSSKLAAVVSSSALIHSGSFWCFPWPMIIWNPPLSVCKSVIHGKHFIYRVLWWYSSPLSRSKDICCVFSVAIVNKRNWECDGNVVESLMILSYPDRAGNLVKGYCQNWIRWWGKCCG